MADTAPPAGDTDPRALRALAHPVRWKLLDVLASEGTATVTRCAEVLGESTATCSYHLGILAKYGYIARVAVRQGREKPWQRASSDLDISSAGLSADGAEASHAAAAAFLDYELSRLKESIRRSNREREPWQRPNMIMGATRWVTETEAQEIAAEMQKALDKYASRGTEPADRPDEARQVRLLAAITLTPPLRPAAG